VEGRDIHLQRSVALKFLHAADDVPRLLREAQAAASLSKTQRKPLRAIAAELGVDVVVEGSALRSGERALVKASLIDAATDRHLWANEYQRAFADVISLHRELALAIAGEIKAARDGDEIVEALEFLSAKTASDARAAARFLREAQAGGSLDHPHICRVHGLEEHESRSAKA
jgi:serine/threonine protein kinase